MAQFLVDLTRVLYGSVFLARLWRCIEAKELIWAHRPPKQLSNLLWAQAAAAVAFTLGLFSGPACIALFILNLILNRAATFYGLEDINFQFISFFFLFSGAGRRLSLDSLLGWDLAFDPLGIPIFGLALLLIMLGGVFFATGVGKAKCPLWRRGLGTYVFFLSPIYRKFDIDWIVGREWLIRALNHVTLAFQLGILPALLVNCVPLGALFFLAVAGFIFSLAAVFTLTWIGEVLVTIVPACAWVIWTIGRQGLGGFIMQSWPTLTPHGQLAAGAILLAIFCGLWVCLIPAAGPGPVAAMTRRMRVVSRLTWGLSPISVFTARDFAGPIVFRVFGGGEEVFKIYGPDCGFGPDRYWKPHFVEGTALKIAEICEELDLYGEVRNQERAKLMRAIAEYIRKVSFKSGKEPSTLDFHVFQIIYPQRYAGAAPLYSGQPWVEALRVHFDGARATRIERLAKKILAAPTGRDLSRTTFAFTPER